MGHAYNRVLNDASVNIASNCGVSVLHCELASVQRVLRCNIYAFLDGNLSCTVTPWKCEMSGMLLWEDQSVLKELYLLFEGGLQEA